MRRRTCFDAREKIRSQSGGLDMGLCFKIPVSASARDRAIDRRTVRDAFGRIVRKPRDAERRIVCIDAPHRQPRKLGRHETRHPARAERQSTVTALQRSVRCMADGNAGRFSVYKGGSRAGSPDRTYVCSDPIKIAAIFNQGRPSRPKKSLRIMDAASLSTRARISVPSTPDFQSRPRAS